MIYAFNAFYNEIIVIFFYETRIIEYNSHSFNNRNSDKDGNLDFQIRNSDFRTSADPDFSIADASALSPHRGVCLIAMNFYHFFFFPHLLTLNGPTRT